MKYKNLLSKGTIDNLELKNRVVMSPMSPGVATLDGEVTDDTIAYYEARAKGGVGLIILGALKINDETGTFEARGLSIAKDEYIPGMKRIADSIHQYGAKVFAQIGHPGRQAYSRINKGNPCVAPSAIPCMVCRQETKALSIKEIESMVQDFIDAARRLQAADMDGVELHASHGYLINQFLSPYSNKRTDEYGGSLENRMRFIEDIIKGIRDKCGKDFIISVRIPADEFLEEFGVSEDGINLQEGVRIAKYLDDLGVDAINVSSGIFLTTNTIIEPTSYPQGWRIHLAEEVKKVVKAPVIAASVIRKPEFAEELLENHIVDFVALGRGLLADPDWVKKAEEGRESEIIPCISCLNCLELVYAEKASECAVNIEAARELQLPDLIQNGNDRVVVIIGAGPAGMEAGRILAIRGFKPILFEREKEVGGQLQLANKPLHKEKMNWLIDYLANQLDLLGIETRLGTEPSIKEIKRLDPYAIFIATGSSEIVPKIQGIQNENVYLVSDILQGKVKIEDKEVAVIGGGMTGLETAELLAEQGNKVTIIEMLGKIGQGIYTPNRIDIMNRLKKHDVKMLANHKLESVVGTKVVLEDLIKKIDVELMVDHVVLSLGVKPNNQIVESIKQNFENVIVIGDAKETGRIAHAIKTGHMEARNLC